MTFRECIGIAGINYHNIHLGVSQVFLQWNLAHFHGQSDNGVLLKIEMGTKRSSIIKGGMVLVANIALQTMDI